MMPHQNTPKERMIAMMKRFLSLLTAFTLICSSGLAASKSKKPTARDITRTVVEEVPETIQQLLDLAWNEWQATDAQELKTKNKYTKWRNNYDYGWCGGFITWCMLELNIPQKEKNKTKKEEVEGIVHVKEAGVG